MCINFLLLEQVPTDIWLEPQMCNLPGLGVPGWKSGYSQQGVSLGSAEGSTSCPCGPFLWLKPHF